MPGTLDNILNIAIPAGIFIFFGFTIYKGLKEPIDKFIAGIKSLLADPESEAELNLWKYDLRYY